MSLSPTAGRLALRLAVAPIAAITAIGSAAVPAAAADSVSYDFEPGSTTTWPHVAINGFGSLVTVAAPGQHGGRAVRYNVPNDGRSFRAELAIKGLDFGAHRFSFSDYLPGDWTRLPLDSIVAQWFNSQGTNEGVKPVIALSVHDDYWQMKVHWGSTAAEQEAVVPLGPVQFGHWNRWTFDVVWSGDGKPGSIVAARDGVQVGTHQGPNNYQAGEPPHFRIGLYRPNWRPEKPPHPLGGPDAVIYADDISITSAPGAPAPVAAAPSTAPRSSAAATGSVTPSRPGSATSAPQSPSTSPADVPSPTGADPTVSEESDAGTDPNADQDVTGTELRAAGLPTLSAAPVADGTGPSAMLWVAAPTALLLAAGGYALRRRRPGGRARHK